MAVTGGRKSFGKSGPRALRPCSAQLGSARPGPARLGSARLGSARLGPARLGSARLCSATGPARCQKGFKIVKFMVKTYVFVKI